MLTCGTVVVLADSSLCLEQFFYVSLKLLSKNPFNNTLEL